MTEPFVEKALKDKDPQLDLTLRPAEFGDFIGQERVKERLGIFIRAARERGEALEHAIFSGPPGLGKTTLAYLIAKAMGSNIKAISGPVIEKAGDLAGLLTNLENGDILFIDEIHRINKVIEEYLYPAMEDFTLDIIIDQGPNARSVRLNLARFTLLGATTRSGLISAPLRSRFGMAIRLDYYPVDDLDRIVLRSARILGVEIDGGGSAEIARRARGTPRIANNLLRRVRDYAQVKAGNRITAEIADAALAMLDVDRHGLDEMDARILTTIIRSFGGGPVGIGSIAVAVGEEPGTLEEVYEPYLIQQGYLKRTSQGRVATDKAYGRFGEKKNGSGAQGEFL
ncbi:MAG: Holliday junction branch migration DNA helicase RuvB [Chlamydiota bacterium]